MGIYVPNKCWKFRLKFLIRLGENQIFVVVRFFAAPCRPAFYILNNDVTFRRVHIAVMIPHFRLTGTFSNN